MTGRKPKGIGQEFGTTARPNPAAVFCVDRGGTYEVRRAAAGSKSGV